MNTENQGMQLRQRRVLSDISNKIVVAPPATEIPSKKLKRRVSNDLRSDIELNKYRRSSYNTMRRYTFYEQLRISENY